MPLPTLVSPTPAGAFQQPGLYPSAYRVSTDAQTGAVTVSLEGLTRR